MLYLVFELNRHLIDLGTLHVQVVDVVLLYDFVDTKFLIRSNKRLDMNVTETELVDHELLKTNDVDDVEDALEVVKDHDADLICYAAVVEVFKHVDH